LSISIVGEKYQDTVHNGHSERDTPLSHLLQDRRLVVEKLFWWDFSLQKRVIADVSRQQNFYLESFSSIRRQKDERDVDALTWPQKQTSGYHPLAIAGNILPDGGMVALTCHEHSRRTWQADIRLDGRWR